MWKTATSESEAGTAGPAHIDWHGTLHAHDRWLRTVVYARVREPEAVDEVMQEVALAAVRQAAPFADPTKVAPWLYRLAVRQSLLYRRKCGRRRRFTSRYAERASALRHHASPTIRSTGCCTVNVASWCARHCSGWPTATRRSCCSNTVKVGVITRLPIIWESATVRWRPDYIEPDSACAPS